MNGVGNKVNVKSLENDKKFIFDAKFKNTDVVSLYQFKYLEVWKAFKKANWKTMESLISLLESMGHIIIINTSDPVPFDFQSLSFYITKPIVFLYETKCILDKLLKEIDSKILNYNEFVISSYLYTLTNFSETKLMFLKVYEHRFVLIHCVSFSFIDINSCFKAIIGCGENYKSFTNIQYYQNEDRSWTIVCKISLSSEEDARIKEYSIDNHLYNHNIINIVKLLAGGSYASTSLAKEKSNNQHVVFKAAQGNGFSKLRDEILWISKLSPKRRKFYPEIISFEINNEKEECWMNQVYYPWPSVTSYLMNNGFNKFSNYDYNTVEILNFLIDILHQNKVLFYKRKVESTPNDFFVRFHKNKIINRLQEAQSMNWSHKELIDSRYLILDGDKLLGPLQLIRCFEKINQYTHIIDPPYLCTLHGDLNIGNILVNPASFNKCYKDYSNLSVKFIDPRGWIDYSTKEFIGQDYMYDMAKIAYHFFGYYDQVRANMVKVFINETENAIPNFTMEFPQYNKGTDEFTNPIAKQYYYLQAAMLNYLIKEKTFLGLEKEFQWKIRFIFTLGSCMISDIPFLLKGPDGNNKAVAIFALGTLFFNYAWEMIVSYFRNIPSDLPIKDMITELVDKYPIIWRSSIENSKIETILENLGEKLSPICNLYSLHKLEEEII